MVYKKRTLHSPFHVIFEIFFLNDYEGAQVRMSRTGDTTVSLANRATMANNWNADYFVSVHINAGGGTGLRVIYSSKSLITNGSISEHRFTRKL